MAVPHGDHVRDVFHHEHLGFERFEHPREFEVEEVPGVLQISRPYLAEPLAGRAPEHQVDFAIDKLPLGGHTRMLVDEEAGHVSSKHGYLREIDPVGTRGVLVHLYRARQLEPREADALTESSSATE